MPTEKKSLMQERIELILRENSKHFWVSDDKAESALALAFRRIFKKELGINDEVLVEDFAVMVGTYKISIRNTEHTIDKPSRYFSSKGYCEHLTTRLMHIMNVLKQQSETPDPKENILKIRGMTLDEFQKKMFGELRPRSFKSYSFLKNFLHDVFRYDLGVESHITFEEPRTSSDDNVVVMKYDAMRSSFTTYGNFVNNFTEYKNYLTKEILRHYSYIAEWCVTDLPSNFRDLIANYVFENEKEEKKAITPLDIIENSEKMFDSVSEKNSVLQRTFDPNKIENHISNLYGIPKKLLFKKIEENSKDEIPFGSSEVRPDFETFNEHPLGEMFVAVDPAKETEKEFTSIVAKIHNRQLEFYRNLVDLYGSPKKITIPDCKAPITPSQCNPAPYLKNEEPKKPMDLNTNALPVMEFIKASLPSEGVVGNPVLLSENDSLRILYRNTAGRVLFSQDFDSAKDLTPLAAEGIKHDLMYALSGELPDKEITDHYGFKRNPVTLLPTESDGNVTFLSINKTLSND